MKLIMENFNKFLKEEEESPPSKEYWLKILNQPEIKDGLDFDTPPENIEKYAEELVRLKTELKQFNTQEKTPLTYKYFLINFENVGISMNNAKVIAQHLQKLAEEKNSPGLSNVDKYRKKALELIQTAKKEAEVQVQFLYPTDEEVKKLKIAFEKIIEKDESLDYADVWKAYNGTGYGFVFNENGKPVWKDFIDDLDRGLEEI